jgi:hypothetical protein
VLPNGERAAILTARYRNWRDNAPPRRALGSAVRLS